MPTTTTPTFDGYIRVSKKGKRAGASYITEAEQRAKIEGWAKLRNVKIGEWFTDKDVSGGKLERPGLDKLLVRLEAGETEGVAVAKLDRLSRLGVADALKLVERIADAGGEVAAIDIGIDPTTPVGKFARTIMLALAQMERERIGEAWEGAQSRAVDRGAMVGPTPFGYERQTDDAVKGVLVPHPAESVHVCRAYELAGSQGIGAATRYLAEHASDDRYWTTATVRRMLAKRTYLGEVRVGPGRVRVDELAPNLEAHEPLVSRAVWEAAQCEPRARATSGDYPLSGVACCETCGLPMVAGPKSSTGKRMYRCSGAQTLTRGERCSHPAVIVADRLEGHILPGVRSALRGNVRTTDGSDELVKAEQRMVDEQDKLQALIDATDLRDLAGRDTFMRSVKKQTTIVEKATGNYRELARQSQSLDNAAIESILDGTDLRAVGELLRGLLSVTVKPGRGTVEDRTSIVVLD
jgi:site-specific DNA recombinase